MARTANSHLNAQSRLSALSIAPSTHQAEMPLQKRNQPVNRLLSKNYQAFQRPHGGLLKKMLLATFFWQMEANQEAV